MVSAILSRLVILVFGTLYPAYASYKAVKTKNIKEYVKWMMYWIVFALFCTMETFSDVLLSWIPFYYEVKIVFVFWLLSPVTKGSSFLYKKFVHPQLSKREKEIDEAIAQARTKGYSTMLTLGHKGLTYATNVVVKTAIKGQSTLVDHIRKSYSTNDLRVADSSNMGDQVDSALNDSDEEFGFIDQTDRPEKQDFSKREVRKKENRLLEDNNELRRKEMRTRERRQQLTRTKSDTTDSRRQALNGRSSVPAGLSRLEEVEHEASISQDNLDAREPEEGGGDEEVCEEIVYYPKRTYTNKEVKMDPYATLPRTRSRQRPRLNQY